MFKLLLLFSFIMSFSALAYTNIDHSINVNGVCKKNIIPDRIKVSISVEILDKDQKVSTNKANKKYNDILQAYKNLNLKDAEFETTDYRIFPYKTWEKQKEVFKGYKTNISFTVSTSEVDKASDMLSIGHEDGQDFVSGPDSFVSDELYKTTYNECLTLASNDGEEKAKIIAKANNLKIQKLIAVYEGTHQVQSPMPVMRKSMTMMEDRPNIELGKTSVHVNLNMYYSIK